MKNSWSAHFLPGGAVPHADTGADSAGDAGHVSRNITGGQQRLFRKS